MAGQANLAQAQANTPPAGYARCAGENQFCDFNGAASVVYGAGNTWTAPRTFTGYTVSCSNYTFGDPLPNMSKACYAKAVDTPPPPPPQPTVDTPPAGYTRCASENGRCSFTGTTNVVYGALGSWTAPRSFTNGTACTNNLFGDPAYGKAKSCYRQDTAAVAKVNLNLTITGTGGVGFSDGSSCSANCSKPFDSGSSVTLAATASSGHNFSGWSGACSGTGSTCTVSMTEARNVTATFVPAVATRALAVTVAGGGKVQFSDGSSCAANCTKTFNNGSTVTLSASADAGNTFGGWGSACSGTAGCTVTMDAAKSVSATFNAVVAGGTDPALGLTACLPSGKGTDYQVGPNAGQLGSLDLVPWDKLTAGDTVRIFHRAAAYTGKFHISGNGTAAAPVRVCGVKGPNGERPVISGKDAVSPSSLQGVYGLNGTQAELYNEARGVIFVGRRVTQDWKAYPTHIQIDGLNIKSAAPEYSYTTTFGVKRKYEEFGACIWIDRGHNVTVADNEVSDCTNGIFSDSKENKNLQGQDEYYALTMNVRLAGNYIHGNGVVGKESQHNTYMQSIGMVYEFNRYGPPRSGALGNALKDRSVGAVVRYNRIEEGAHAIDLVEAEEYRYIANSLPAYRTTFVYGNQIVKTGNTGSFIHYGGDHGTSVVGDNWGEAYFRKGTLYFFNNTIHAKGTYAALFQLATTEEKAEIWNNVFYFDSTVVNPRMRQQQDVGAAWVNGGILNFGRNWINGSWSDAGPYHTVNGQLLNKEKLITGSVAPIDLASLAPLAGSALIDAGLAGPAGASAYPVNFQLDGNFKSKARGVIGSASDLGALEGASTATPPATAVLTVTASAGGSVSSAPAGIQCGSTCSASFATNSQVALTATPAAGYAFSGWSGSCTGTGACSVSLNTAKSVSANFTAVATTRALNLSVSGSGGVGFSDGTSCASACTKSFSTGASVVLAASPATGYTFSGWSGGCSGTGNCTLTMDAVKNVAATFVRASTSTQAVTLTVTGSGSVAFTGGSSCSATCTKSFDSGSNVTLSATPAAGFTFGGWTGGACSGTSNCVLSMSVARNVGANFVATTASQAKPDWSMSPLPAPWNYQIAQPSRSACAADEGRTFEVGAGKAYANPRDVPWLSLVACDQVLINHRAQPYTDIIVIGSRGAANKYITVKGVPGPNGERPVFDGNGAVTPKGTGVNEYTDGGGMIMVVKPTEVPGMEAAYGYKPGFLHFTGLKIQNVRAPAKYANRLGTVLTWPEFTAGLFVMPGESIAVTNMEFADNSLGLFVNSQDNEKAQSYNLLVSNNYFHGNGVVDKASEHNAYTEAIGTIYEYNYFGAPVVGTGGDNIKDRSAGVIFRYNFIEDGVNLISLRDPQSNAVYEAAALDAQGERLVSKAFIYSNVFSLKNRTVYGDPSVVVSHGDGKFGDARHVRDGALYFYSNKVISINDAILYHGTSVPVFDMLNTRSLTTVHALNNQFYAQKKTSAGTAAPFALFYYQGLANWQQNWINGYQLTYASQADTGLAVGVPFNGAGLGGLVAQPNANPGFVNLGAGDYRSAAGSPFLTLNAPLPAAVTSRGLAPAGLPVTAPFTKP